MQSLLRWSIEHSTPSDGSSTTPAPQPRADLDPAIIDHILGRPDAELMKEYLAVAQDETRELDDRLQALDNFEMVRLQSPFAVSESLRERRVLMTCFLLAY